MMLFQKKNTHLEASLLESGDDLADESTREFLMMLDSLPSLDTVGPGELALIMLGSGSEGEEGEGEDCVG